MRSRRWRPATALPRWSPGTTTSGDTRTASSISSTAWWRWAESRVSKRVAILTGGGDVPGLNMVIKGFVARMEEAGHEVIGLRRGWSALLNIRPDRADNSDWVVELTRAST